MHIPWKVHTRADSLSRPTGTAEQIKHAGIEAPEELEQCLDNHLFIPKHVAVRLVSSEYIGQWGDIGRLLEEIGILEGLTLKQREAFSREATMFLVRDRHLFRSGHENKRPGWYAREETTSE